MQSRKPQSSEERPSSGFSFSTKGRGLTRSRLNWNLVGSRLVYSKLVRREPSRLGLRPSIVGDRCPLDLKDQISWKVLDSAHPKQIGPVPLAKRVDYVVDWSVDPGPAGCAIETLVGDSRDSDDQHVLGQAAAHEGMSQQPSRRDALTAALQGTSAREGRAFILEVYATCPWSATLAALPTHKESCGGSLGRTSTSPIGRSGSRTPSSTLTASGNGSSRRPRCRSARSSCSTPRSSSCASTVRRNSRRGCYLGRRGSDRSGTWYS